MRDEYIDEMINTMPNASIRREGRHDRLNGAINNIQGTVLVFVNSAKGYASRIARPALEMALQHQNRPDNIATIFAGTDTEATLHAQKYFPNQAVSSPSFTVMHNGVVLDILNRSRIEAVEPPEVAALLVKMFDKYCISRG